MDNSEVFHDAFIKMINFAKEHLSKELFDEFLYAVYTYGIENVYIEEIPVYENVEWNGAVLYKYIKYTKYAFECNVKPDAVPKDNDKKNNINYTDWAKKNQARTWNAWNS